LQECQAPRVLAARGVMRAEGSVGVGCVKTPARAWPLLNEPSCVETQQVESPDNAESFRIARSEVRGEMSLMVLGYNLIRVVNLLGVGAFQDYCAQRQQAGNSQALAQLAG